MGFLEKLGKAMVKVVGGESTMQQHQQNWEENMTLEDIIDLEQKGCDMTEYRRKYEARVAAEAKRIQDSIDKQDLSMLDAYKNTPRDENSAFILDVYQIAEPSKKEKLKILDARIVYGAIVQAHHALWKPGDNDESTALVLVFSTGTSQYNVERLKEVAGQIAELKESGDVPTDCQKLIKMLRDDQSIFCYKVGDSLSHGEDMWCATQVIKKQSALPDSFIPATRIVPFLLIDEPQDDWMVQLEMIPAKYYTKS